VVFLGNYIAKIDADAKLNPLVFGDGRVALFNLVLYLVSAANCLDNAGEFSDDAISGPAKGDRDARR
jgi:hypothetical protein